jgi:polysaccharide biosynthesis protein PslH
MVPRSGRVLMVVPVTPSDRGNGLAMRAAFFLDAYSRRFEVDLVVAPVSGSADVSAFVQSRARTIKIFSLGPADTHYVLAASVRDPLARIEALRRYRKPSLTARIGPLSRALAPLVDDDYTAVHIFRLYLAELAVPWFERDSRDRPLLVLDCDENDAVAYRRLAAMERQRRDPIAAAFADVQAQAFAGFMSTWLPKFDLLLAASDREMKSLTASAVRGAVVPNVVRIPAVRPPPRRRASCSILFVGTLGYAPNADAVIWFVSRVWRRFQRLMNFRARLLIVGPHPPAAIARFGSMRGVEVTGAVADVARYYRLADLVVAPLRAGGGTRLKIIEAAAYGVPVVATRIAAEGTTFQPGVDMLVADHEDRFLHACLLLARNRPLAKRMAARARIRVKQDYCPEYWGTRVADLVIACKETQSDEAFEHGPSVCGGIRSGLESLAKEGLVRSPSR